MAKADEMSTIRAQVSSVEKQRPAKISDEEWDKLRSQIEAQTETDTKKLREKYPYLFAERTGDTREHKDTGVELKVHFNSRYKRTHFNNVPQNMKQHVKPIMQEMEGLKLPIPTRRLAQPEPAGNVEDHDGVNQYDEESVGFFASQEVPGSLHLSQDQRDSLLLYPGFTEV